MLILLNHIKLLNVKPATWQPEEKDELEPKGGAENESDDATRV